MNPENDLEANIGFGPHEHGPEQELGARVLARPRFGPWLAAVTAGEVLGFTSTALIAFLALLLWGHPSTVSGRVAALAIMTFAGTVEG